MTTSNSNQLGTKTLTFHNLYNASAFHSIGGYRSSNTGKFPANVNQAYFTHIMGFVFSVHSNTKRFYLDVSNIVNVDS